MQASRTPYRQGRRVALRVHLFFHDFNRWGSMSDTTQAPAPLEPSVGSRGHTILVVEDHEATRSALKTLLTEAFPSCRIMATDSGERALLICKTELPRLVVMDIALPGMNGIEATRWIKQQHEHTRVVMHSTSDMPIYQQEALSAGADAFISKTRNASELLSAICTLLRV